VTSCVPKARRVFDGLLDELARGAEADKRDALLALAARLRAEAEVAGSRIPLARTREALAEAGVEFKSDGALKMALSRASK